MQVDLKSYSGQGVVFRIAKRVFALCLLLMEYTILMQLMCVVMHSTAVNPNSYYKSENK